MSRGLTSTLRDAWEGIRAQPGRVGLSFMAIVVGISTLTVLIAVLGGLRERASQMVQDLGVNVVAILREKGFDENAAIGLEERHASLLAANLPCCLVSTLRRYDVAAPGAGKVLTLIATDHLLMLVRRWRLVDGRFLDKWDLERSERSVVISRTLSEEWNWSVGNYILVQDTPVRIVGIVETGGGAQAGEVGDSRLMLGERAIFVPKTVIPVLIRDNRKPPSGIEAIFLRVPPFMDFSQVVSTSRRLLSQPDQRVGEVAWATPESLIQGITRLRRTIGLTVGSVVVLCLGLGGTTLMSLMLANVRERIPEIGLRRAMGARRRDVARLFVTEALMVGGGAAIVGTGLGYLAVIMGSELFPVPVKLALEGVLVPVVVALVVGLVFSYWPARAAARIVPSEALRYE